MGAHHLVHRASAWLALVAMLLMACAPTLTQAFATERHGSSAGVCSMAAVHEVADAAPEHFSKQALEHCPYCLLHEQAHALPSEPWVLPVLQLAEHRPSVFWQAARTAHAWRSAQPRAPPATLS